MSYKNKELLNINKFFSDFKKKKKLWTVIENSETLKGKSEFQNYFMISYIIEIMFSRTNTYFSVKTACGRLILYYSAGSLIEEKNKIKKMKIRRRKVIKKIFSKLINLNFLKNEPVALHLVNLSFSISYAILRLKKIFFIKLIKIFELYPFNGCRGKKIRRKKFRRFKKIRRKKFRGFKIK